MRQIPKFENYSITKDGRVWSNRYNRWLKPCRNHKGYLRIVLCNNKKHYTKATHRLVLETYVGPCPKGMECRHLNGNPVDNRLENLCWGTKSENTMDAIQHGTHNCLPTGKLHIEKLSNTEKDMVVQSYNYGGYTLQELADTYCVTRQTIKRIVNQYVTKQRGTR